MRVLFKLVSLVHVFMALTSCTVFSMQDLSPHQPEKDSVEYLYVDRDLFCLSLLEAVNNGNYRDVGCLLRGAKRALGGQGVENLINTLHYDNGDTLMQRAERIFPKESANFCIGVLHVFGAKDHRIQ